MPWSDMYSTYAAHCNRAGGRLQVASLCHQADHVKTRHARLNGLPCDATAKPYPSSSEPFIPGAGSASPALQLALVLGRGALFNVTSPITQQFVVVQAARLLPPIMLTISSPQPRLCRHAQHIVGEPRCSRRTRSALRHFKGVDMKSCQTARPTTTPHSLCTDSAYIHTCRCEQCPYEFVFEMLELTLRFRRLCSGTLGQSQYLNVCTRLGCESWCNNVSNASRVSVVLMQ
jgi:hypothetical protein